MQCVFIVCQIEDYQNILKLSCIPLAFNSYKAFSKNKKRSGTSLPASFSALFLKKNIFLVIHSFLFISNTFISKARLKLAKNQANAKKHPEAELLLFENY